jgi:hypothetical protein
MFIALYALYSKSRLRRILPKIHIREGLIIRQRQGGDPCHYLHIWQHIMKATFCHSFDGPISNLSNL